MTLPTSKGISPAWANLPRRKCDDCGKGYKPKRPLREKERGFCSANCRKSYHKHGGAYRKLKVEVAKLVTREIARRIQLEEPCDCCAGRGCITLGNTGPKSPSQPCPKCRNGAVLTPFGRDVLAFILCPDPWVDGKGYARPGAPTVEPAASPLPPSQAAFRRSK